MAVRRKAPARKVDFELSGKFVPRELFPAGRVKFSTGATGREATQRRAKLRLLREAHAWDVYRAIVDGVFGVEEVVRRLMQSGRDAVPELRADLAAKAMDAIPVFGRPPLGDDPGVGAAADYLRAYPDLGLEGRSEHSVSSRASELRRLGQWRRSPSSPPLSDMRVDQIGDEELRLAIASCSDSTNRRESLKLAASALFTWVAAREAEEARRGRRAPRWSENPAARIPSARKVRRPVTASDDQIVALLTAAEPYQLAYLRTFVHLGLRLSELTHLRVHADVDLLTWELRIQPRQPDPRCSCRKCQGRGWKPKTPLSHRTLLVPGHAGGQELRSAVASYVELYPAGSGDFLFRNPRTGGVWLASALEDDFRKLCLRAGVRYGRDAQGGITVHTLRHNCATALVRAGVRESVGAAILGETVETFVNTYVHLTPGDLADGIARAPSYAASL